MWLQGKPMRCPCRPQSPGWLAIVRYSIYNGAGSLRIRMGIRTSRRLTCRCAPRRREYQVAHVPIDGMFRGGEARKSFGNISGVSHGLAAIGCRSPNPRQLGAIEESGG